MRLRLVGILDSEPDGLAMLAAYVQQAVLCQARIRFFINFKRARNACIYIYLIAEPLRCQPVLLIEKLTRLCCLLLVAAEGEKESERKKADSF